MESKIKMKAVYMVILKINLSSPRLLKEVAPCRDLPKPLPRACKSIRTTKTTDTTTCINCKAFIAFDYTRNFCCGKIQRLLDKPKKLLLKGEKNVRYKPLRQKNSPQG